MKNSGDRVSILGFGCMRFPTEDGKIIEKESMKMLEYAYKNGINYYDTAWPYHDKQSEPFLGKFLKKINREDIYIATKLPSWYIEKKEDMYEYLEKQLEKLDTDYIDYYLLHSMSKKTWDNLKSNEIFEFIEDLQEGDSVRNIGFSFHDNFKVFKEIIDSYDWSFCQIQYNFMDVNYQAGTRGLKYASDKGLDVIVMEPLRGGMLTRNIPDYIQKIWDECDYKRTPAEWGLRWVWNHSEVSTVLSGMSNMEQIKENIEIASTVKPDSMSDEELKIIERIRDIYKNRIKVNCTNCKYCIPCPEGIDIPQIFTFYNNAAVYNQHDRMKRFYNSSIDDENKASNCVECGECEDKCPQNINIIEKLKQVVKAFED